MNDPTPVTPETGDLLHTVGFEFKLGLPGYSSQTAQVWLQVPTDRHAGILETEEKIKEAFVLAKAAVADQLGVPNHVDQESGLVIIEQAFPNSTVVESTPAGERKLAPLPKAAQGAPRQGGGGEQIESDGLVYPAGFDPDKPKCPACNEWMWDQRPGHGAKFPKKGNQPEFKCKDSDCGKGVWGNPVEG